MLQSMGSQRVRHDLATELMCLYGETEVGCGVRDMGVDVWKDGSSVCVETGFWVERWLCACLCVWRY